MESLDNILNNLSKFKNNEHVMVNQGNNLQIVDINDHFDDAKNLIDMSENYSERINDSLNSIESYKHIIQKVSDSNDEVRLPISHVEHNSTTSFITDTISFFNYLDVNTTSESTPDVIPSKISTWVQVSIQDLRKEVQNCKFITDSVEVLTSNLNIFENSSDLQLNTSLNENVPLESIQE